MTCLTLTGISTGDREIPYWYRLVNRCDSFPHQDEKPFRVLTYPCFAIAGRNYSGRFLFLVREHCYGDGT